MTDVATDTVHRECNRAACDTVNRPTSLVLTLVPAGAAERRRRRRPPVATSGVCVLVLDADKLRPGRPMMARRRGFPTDGLPHRFTLGMTDGPL